jgi:excinuclease ABC subunit A
MLRDMGNTVVVVEHDEATMRAADLVVDFGPGPGVRGGHVVAAGTLEEITKNDKSLTGQYLTGKRSIEIPSERRAVAALSPAARNKLMRDAESVAADAAESATRRFDVRGKKKTREAIPRSTTKRTIRKKKR